MVHPILQLRKLRPREAKELALPRLRDELGSEPDCPAPEPTSGNKAGLPSPPCSEALR